MFHEMNLDDLSWVSEICKNEPAFSSEYSPFCLYSWGHVFHTEIDRIDGFLVGRFDPKDEPHSYLTPIGPGDANAVVDKLIALDKASGRKRFRMLASKKQAELFAARDFVVSPRRDIYDYVYNASDLIELKGAKYHNKRNLIAQFERNYDWSFRPLTEENQCDCRKVMRHWIEQDAAGRQDDATAEQSVIRRFFAHGDRFNGVGGILYVMDKPVAFSLGTVPRPSVMDTHIEKGDVDYVGVYPMIMREFTKYAHARYGFSHVNREEDMGIPNLRRAKLELHPAFLEEKVFLQKDL